ncbi:MAG: AAA family ATPase [Saprospiraceae bacterium]
MQEDQPTPEGQQDPTPAQGPPSLPPLPASQPAAASAGTSKVQDLALRIRAELQRAVVGQSDTIDFVIAALLADGHVLLEGVPGVAKTMVARLLAKVIKLDYSRIQFTPDLMPSDLLGTNVYNMKESNFQFQAGPIFSQVILIDEINRAPAKTQAALFEVMEEGQVTTDGVTRKLDDPYIVVATQNPIDQEGTYRLPEAQLDRFLFKLTVDYPTLEEEKGILRRFRKDFRHTVEDDLKMVATSKDILEARQAVEQVHIEDGLLDYIANLTVATREDPGMYLAASPRASLSLLQGAKAIAAMNGRDYVIPEDIRLVSLPVLRHRLMLTPEREMEGGDLDTTIRTLIEQTEVPR